MSIIFKGRPYGYEHQFCSNHRKLITNSNKCGCFYCFKIFTPEKIKEWVDDHNDEIGQTAICPYCGIDAILPSSAPKVKLTKQLLKNMHEFWFSIKQK